MAWNKHREDVLAVGYNGVVEDGSLPTDGGLVLFWSLRNPGYPERVASLESGCSSIAFSEKNPHLLAVGLMDGAVYIYDVRQKTLQPTPQEETDKGNTKSNESAQNKYKQESNKREEFFASSEFPNFLYFRNIHVQVRHTKGI